MATAQERIDAFMSDPKYANWPAAKKADLIAKIHSKFDTQPAQLKSPAPVPTVAPEAPKYNFLKSLGSDVKQNVMGAVQLANTGSKIGLDALTGGGATTLFSGGEISPARATKEDADMMKTIGQGIMDMPKVYKDNYSHPFDYAKEHPLSVALDLWTALEGGAAIRGLAKSAVRVLPGVDRGAIEAAKTLGVEKLQRAQMIKAVTSKERATQELAGTIKGIENIYGSGKPIGELADKVVGGISDTERAWHKNVNTMYDEAIKRAPADTKFQMTNVMDAIDKNLDRIPDIPMAKGQIKELTELKKTFGENLAFKDIKKRIDYLGDNTEWNAYKISQMDTPDRIINSVKQDIWRKGKSQLISKVSAIDPQFDLAYKAADSVYKDGLFTAVKKTLNNVKGLVENNKFEEGMRRIVYPGMSQENLGLVFKAAGTPEAQDAIRAYVAKDILDHSFDNFGEIQSGRMAQSVNAWKDNLTDIFGKEGADKFGAVETLAKGLKKMAGASGKIAKAKQGMLSLLISSTGANKFVKTNLGNRWLSSLYPAGAREQE